MKAGVVLKNLKGVKSPTKPSVIFKRSYCVKNILENGYAATAMERYGAMNVWMDDEYTYHGELDVHRQTMDEIITEDINELMKWVSKNMEGIK